MGKDVSGEGSGKSAGIQIVYDDGAAPGESERRKTTTTEEAFVKDRESHMHESTVSSHYPDSADYDPKNPSRSVAGNTTIKMSSSGTDTANEDENKLVLLSENPMNFFNL